MTNTLVHKYQTLKKTKCSKRPTAEDVFLQHPKSASSPSLFSPAQPKSYPLFIAELISAFNSLSASTASPTSSSTLHTFFQGADHEAHVSGQQKKKVVKALQHADPAKVNEIIALLKAMPDPTAESTTANQSDTKKSTARASNPGTEDRNGEKKRIKKEQEQLDKELAEWDKIDKKRSWETPKSNDQATGIVDTESNKGPTSTSWWFSSPAPAPASAPAAIQDDKENKNPAGFGSLWLTTKTKPSMDPSSAKKQHQDTPKKSLSSGEQIARAAASLLAIAASSKPKELKSDTNATSKSSALHRQSSMPNINIKSTALKALLPTSKSMPTGCKIDPKKRSTTDIAVSADSPSYLVTTINSIAKQFLWSQQGPPSAYTVSAYTFWWGFEIYVPHKCMATIERVSNTGQIFFNILTGAIAGIPGLAALVPIAKIISAWVDYQWSVIKAEDMGKGVVISATWVLPVALASRSWDRPSCESLKSKLKLTGM
ncbi:hypothetical protein BC939DRAFT_445887 [Gamsiella multidivaricata]|uniref:uncharacterized protein n=1 Tax=Gamsiella multidivaricata TaxID=101098 RepID=UPI002220E5C2|nr:uncharacterized protein BC939DRAFT_445887 [Gamsiella multidivaricata]KAG0364025.1 hypothetical protein BGZ54_007903 [Gamsiella multidivaricata]KAI7827134.1 hypothetical protein BC939DRAFT_445887 [Gamsiella multidivaricata]